MRTNHAELEKKKSVHSFELFQYIIIIIIIIKPIIFSAYFVACLHLDVNRLNNLRLLHLRNSNTVIIFD